MHRPTPVSLQDITAASNQTDLWSQVWPLLVAYPGAVATVYGAAAALDDLTTELGKSEFSGWLKKDLSVPSKKLFAFVHELFIHWFGKKHWSFRCLGVSLLASHVLFVLLLLLWLSNFNRADLPQDFWSAPTLIVSVLLVVLINGVADFLSLWKARWIIEHLRRASFVRMLLSLAGDAVFSLAIGCLAFIVGVSLEAAIEGVVLAGDWSMSSFASAFQAETRRLVNRPSEFLSLFATSDQWAPPPSVWAYTTCLTCLWTCLFAVSASLLKLAHAFDVPLKWLRPRIQIDKQPFRSAAVMLIALLSMGFAVYGGVRFLL